MPRVTEADRYVVDVVGKLGARFAPEGRTGAFTGRIPRLGVVVYPAYKPDHRQAGVMSGL